MNLYLFTGDPWFRDQAVEKLKGELAQSGTLTETTLDGDDFNPQRFVEALQSQSLFDDGVLLHLKRIEKLKDPLVLLPYIENATAENTHIVLEGEKLDKRSKLYKAIAKIGKAEDFGAPSKKDLPTMLAKMVKERDLQVSQPGFRYLLENVQNDMARIGSEVEKLSIYYSGEELDEEAIRGLLFHDKEGDLFSSLDALMERKPVAITKIQEVLDSGEEASKLFFVLARQVRGLIKTKSLADEGAKNDVIAKKTGDFPWLVSKRRALVQRLTLRELVDFLQALHEEDLKIKRGERQPEEAFWALVFLWMSPEPVIAQ